MLGTMVAVALFGTGQAVANHLDCGDVVTTNTTLDSDLVDCPGDGLTIGANGVNVDLDGHLIDGTYSALSDGIDNSGGFDGVTIKNGRIREFYQGIYLAAASRNVIRDLTVGSTYAVWLFDSVDNVIERNVISETGAGVALIGDSERNRVRRNSISSAGNAVWLYANFDAPYRLPDNNLIAYNLMLGNEYGVTAFGGTNRVASNTILDNEYGLHLQSAHGEFTTNYIAGGEIGIRTGGGTSASIYRNEVHDVSEDGVHVVGAGGALLEGNLIEGSADDGIDIDSSGVTVTRNTSNSNGDLGIEAVPGVTDGGGNRASGNGNPAQCTNVACN